MSIDRLLRDTEAIPLPMDVLGKMAGQGHRCRAITYEKVEQAEKLSEIVNEQHPYAILLIFDKRDPAQKVGHYVALFLQGKESGWKTVVFWDPYGMKVNKLMHLT